MKYRFLRVSVLCSLFSVLCLLAYAAQSAPAAAKAMAAQPSAGIMSKIGYIDVAKVFDEYQKTKDLDKILEDKQNKKQAERDRMVEEIRKLKDELELLSEKVKQDKQDLIDDKIKKLQDYDRTVMGDLKMERDKMARDILKEIDAAIQEFGQKGNCAVIMNRGVLLYVDEKDESCNFTSKITAILNDRYKAGKGN